MFLIVFMLMKTILLQDTSGFLPKIRKLSENYEMDEVRQIHWLLSQRKDKESLQLVEKVSPRLLENLLACSCFPYEVSEPLNSQ